MAIDISSETLITRSQAAARLPRNENGRKIHTSTIGRWMLKGVRGTVLEGVKVGGRTYTSVEALRRFSDVLTAPQGSNDESDEHVENELDRLGV